MVRGILGNVHQGCEIFRPFKGMQCTAIALIALLTLSVDYNAQNMTASRIDSILHDGTELYASIIFALSGCVDTALDIKKKNNPLPRRKTFENMCEEDNANSFPVLLYDFLPFTPKIVINNTSAKDSF